ncbi:MAG: hypothetical protein M4579_002685 [Chaenotheca gracillima]|nr:MAG: hypothetical protein M4579_002685 [Chaenotheca gracillima]
MSAEALGRRLSDEVKEESLAEILTAHRARYYSSNSQNRSLSAFGIPVLDHLLENPSISGLGHLPTVHVQGPTSSGKTSIIYYLTAILTLPESLADPTQGLGVTNISLKGRGSAVIILDTDGRFSPSRFKQVIKGHILQHVEVGPNSGGKAGPDVSRSSETQHKPLSLRAPEPSPSTNDGIIDDLVFTSLKHVHIIRPSSTESLQSTLERSLPEYLLHATHPSQNRPVGAIILDSADAFSWSDRLDAMDGASSGNVEAQPSRTRSLLGYLQRLLSVPLLVLSSTSNSSRYPSDSGSLRGIPGPASRGDVLIRVERVPVPKFGPGMSVEEAEKDREQRAEVVRRGEFAAQVEVWGSAGEDNIPRGGTTKTHPMKAPYDGETSSSFRFWVRPEGVRVSRP